MTIRNLDALLSPRAVAIIGATERPGSIGGRITENLLTGGFSGDIFPVHPSREQVREQQVFPSIQAIPGKPEFAIICTPAATVPRIVYELGEKGTRAAVVIAAGLADSAAPGAAPLERNMLEAARRTGLRILGPNCLGLLVPGIGLNASFAHAQALPGNIAFISQSGAVCALAIDWSLQQGIGFSHFISTGNCADIDFGDLLDYVGSLPEAHTILLYLESLKHARKFMSAGRAAARNKPVIVLKSGRVAESSQAALSHTGMLAGEDAVFDAAIRRAGMLRVSTIRELFAAVETLAHAHPVHGERLAIVTNGGGPGVMATDALILGGGQLASLSSATLRTLDGFLPAAWSHANPIDIIGDAPIERYVRALQALEEDPGVDAILLLQSPTAVAAAVDIAAALIPVIRVSEKNILSCWLGGEHAEAARRRFAAAGLPSYDTPEEAIQALRHLAEHRRNQQALTETPRVLIPAVERAGRAEAILSQAAHTKSAWLADHEALALLGEYGIPVVSTRNAASVDEALRAAREIGYPVALKIQSPEITHKTEVGGVLLGLANDAELANGAAELFRRVALRKPEARISGFTVQRMASPSAGVELIVGAHEDPVFGPVILFGHGGVLAEHLHDHAIGLPPLNEVLARDLIRRTKVARLLSGYRNRPAINVESVVGVLLSVAKLMEDHTMVKELDVNPLLASHEGVLALDARVRVAPDRRAASERLAIMPYPVGEEEKIEFDGLEIFLRPIRPEDEPAHRDLIVRLNPEDSYFRFFGIARPVSHAALARFTQIDYDREMAFIANVRESDGKEMTLGVVRLLEDPDRTQAEFSVVVRSDLKGRGLGRALMEKCIRYARKRGLRRMTGQILTENHRMLHLAQDLGFRCLAAPGGSTQVVELTL